MSGSEHELREFVCGALEQNRRWLTAYFLAMTGDLDRAQDLVQEVFVRAVRGAPTYDSASGTLGAWLRGIARNVVYEHVRQHGRDPLLINDAMLAQLDDRAARFESDHADPGHETRRLRLLRECMARLSEHVRQIIEMKYQQRSRSQQIAAVLGMNENAVNVALCRGRKTLQTCIEQKLGQDDG